MLMIAGVFGIGSAANAAQFESVIDAIGIKRTISGTTGNGWEATSKIKGVKWKWPYYESGAHDATMVGKTKVGKDKNPNIGATEIKVSGTRTMIDTIQITIANEGEDASEKAVIGMFGQGKIQKISTSCDEDAASSSDAIYQFEKQGYKPLYIHYISSRGASGAGDVDVTVASSLDDALGACKVQK
jgi:hypothetical protein